MKKTLICIMAGLGLAACGGGAGTTSDNDSATAGGELKNTGGHAATEYTTGATLIANNDCFTCHELNQKSTGPSFQQIADHYSFDTANVENLANKIIKGGVGAWGVVQMTGHPGSSVPEAKEMARYILSMRTAQ